jgi:DNA-binding IclR family transcriptional regulator
LRTNIGRRLEVLRVLLDHEAEGGGGLGVVAVAERLRREKSQISRALKTLTDGGLVERDADSLEYTVGPLVMRLAARAGDQRLLFAASRVVDLLALQIGERLHLSAADGDAAVTIHTVAGNGPVQSAGWVGRQPVLHRSAAGRVLLMDHTEAQVRAVVGDGPWSDAGPGTPSDLADLLTRVARAREDGWAASVDEYAEGLTAVAVPVRDNGHIVAVLHVSGPTSSLAPRLEAVVDALLGGAATIGVNLRLLNEQSQQPPLL